MKNRIYKTAIVSLFILSAVIGASEGGESSILTNLIGLIGVAVLFYPMIKILD